MTSKIMWSLELSDGTCVARVYADDPTTAMKCRPRTFKARDLTARRVVNAECPTPRLYRWLVAQASPSVARLTKNGFVVINESRWAALLSAAEGKEVK
jgi:hypothetical protein